MESAFIPPKSDHLGYVNWKPIEEFKGSYWVSDLGDVCSTGPSKRLLTANAHGGGTVKVSLYHPDTEKYTQRSVARLVAEAFLPASNLPLVKHKDGNIYNNKADNLEYRDYLRTNPRTIMKHALATGYMQRNYATERELVNASRRIGTETTRIRHAIEQAQPLTLLEVFGHAVFTFPEHILPNDKLARTWGLMTVRRAAGIEAREAEQRPIPELPPAPPGPELYGPSEPLPAPAPAVEPPPPDAPPLPAVTFAPEERAAALIAEWADHE